MPMHDLPLSILSAKHRSYSKSKLLNLAASCHARCAALNFYSISHGNGHRWTRSAGPVGASIATALKRAVSVLLAAMSITVIGRNLFPTLGGPIRNLWYRALVGKAFSVPDGRTCHEIVVKLRRALSRRYFVNCIAVRPERYGSVANRNRLRRHASYRHGRSAEADGKATQAGAGDKLSCVAPDSCISPGIANRSSGVVNLSSAAGSARFNIREACQAGEIQQQLQRWLRNKLQIRQCPLGWV
jgi:hypothetical protein